MYKTCKIFFLVIFFLLTNIANSSAQNVADDGPYSVNNIFVSATGKNPTLARNNAVAEAQRNAFAVLLKKLSIDEGFADNISADEINDMVHSQQITNEKIAGNTYSAIFNFTFSESFVTSILGTKQISKNEVKQETFLVLPVKTTAQKSLLWESENDWKAAFEAALKEKSETKIKLPSGTIDDISATNHDVIENANFNNFESLLSKYKSDVIIIAYFNFDELENKAIITLKIIHKFQNKKVKLSFVNVNHLAYPELLSKVATKTIEHINKPQNNSDINSKDPVTVDILVTSLGEWMAIKNRLENMNFIESMKINSISKELVQISINYNRNNGDLIDLFAKNNFNLQERNDGQYFMSLGTKKSFNQ